MLNSLVIVEPTPENGFTIHIWAVALLACSIGLAFLAKYSIFSRARARERGFPQISPPLLSASNYLERDIAICISIAAIGAIMIVKSNPIGFPPSSSSERPPPKIAAH